MVREEGYSEEESWEFQVVWSENLKYDCENYYNEHCNLDKMKSFVFYVYFGYGPKFSDSAKFSLELDEDEIAFLKNYIKKNGAECDYGGIEFENGKLFNKINDAANDAVLNEINKHKRKKIDFFDVDWMGMNFEFYWPAELTE